MHGHWRYESGYIDSIRIARLGAGGEWTDVLVKDAAHLLGAALLDGNPLIMYESDGTSYFQRSVDAGGTDWSSPPLALPYPALDGQLAVSSGIPGYLGDFEYAGQSGYHYVAASDGALSGWEEPVFLMDAPVDNLLLRVVGGLPAIAWQESDSDSIYYRTAADAGGSSWAAGNTIVSGYELRQLADVNGLPAVVYAHSALVYITPFPGSAPGSFYGENVYYIAAADHAGTGWGAAVKLGTAVVSIYTSFEGSETSRVSIMELAGRPAVAWSGDSLFLSQALDASGQSWAEAQALQAPICYLVNLLEHNSKPLVLSASVRSMIANGAAANMIYSSVPDLEPWQP